MPDDLGKVFKSAVNPPDPPGKGGPDPPPVTPSEQVANHAPAPRPQPPRAIGLAVDGEIHRMAMINDEKRSDQANNYTRPQSQASNEHLKSLAKLFQKQVKEQAPANQKTIDRNREQERGDD